jgi:hypothetical protein
MTLTSDTISATLDEVAAEIKDAQNLDELLAGLQAFAAACASNASRVDSRFQALDVDNEMLLRGVDMADLTTFGGDAPADTSGIRSWSASRMLVGACIDDMQIVARGLEP